jgi:hypothetical protein
MLSRRIPALSHVATTMQTLILPDWPHPYRYRRMTDAERWTAEYGFTRGTEYRNGAGQGLAELLDAEPDVTESGTVYPRWTFPDGNAVVLGQCTWRIE